MRYIDSGSRDPGTALGTWLQACATADVVAVRWQSGFFSFDGVGVLLPLMKRLSASGQTVRALVGSNDGATLGKDIEDLRAALSDGAKPAEIAVVAFAGGYFHPKVYHLRRADGSECAYVGSANLTFRGVASVHVEAGMIIDVREGDPPEQLASIAGAIDWWFEQDRPGLTQIRGSADIAALVRAGILSSAPQVRQRHEEQDRGEEAGQSAEARARLAPLFIPPAVSRPSAVPQPPVSAPAMGRAPLRIAVPQPGWPDYVLFDPSAQTPTSGPNALSGAQLPSGALGLVMRLNRDSGRHFFGGAGTSNISLPVTTLGTMRFGIYQGAYRRPRAEFLLRSRFIGAEEMYGEVSETNVMVYGYAQGESGHGDVRMLLPASIRNLADKVRDRGLAVPQVGDFALLEWPTASAPEFRITFLERDSSAHEDAARTYGTAVAASALLSDGACWLLDEPSPSWPNAT